MGSIVSLLTGLVIVVLVFVIFREFVCWYFRLVLIEDKLNKIIALLGGEEKAKELLVKKPI
ncbi:hypothetical protein HZC35_00075 [Candidatus Saganbacteria bacterium]|nr:hypothetical protein [Candidatus Saganbacteria bacterium]